MFKQRSSLIVIPSPLGAINPFSPLTSVSSTLQRAACGNFFRDSHDSETDGHKRERHKRSCEWRLKVQPGHQRHPSHTAPPLRRTSTASTAAHRPSESKSKLKSSSKRITSSKYTLTTGSFPEQGAKQITDNRYAERTTQSVRELWENTTISTGHPLNNTKKPNASY